MSLAIHYDSTFDGFLSVVFEVYRQHLDVGDIIPDRHFDDGAAKVMDMFMQPFQVETSEESARRLKRAIVNAASEDVLNLLVFAFHSEEASVEMKMLVYLRKLFAGLDPDYGKNKASLEMLPLLKIAQSVRREAGDMRGMVRFNKAPDGLYFAEIEPKYNILWCIVGHFKARFPNGRWAILDSKRGYGVYYDGHESHEVTVPDPSALAAGAQPDEFSQMWKSYYQVMSIKERENPRLLRRCLPVRYWKHLTERQQDCIKVGGADFVPSVVAKRNAARAIAIQGMSSISGG